MKPPSVRTPHISDDGTRWRPPKVTFSPDTKERDGQTDYFGDAAVASAQGGPSRTRVDTAPPLHRPPTQEDLKRLDRAAIKSDALVNAFWPPIEAVPGGVPPSAPISASLFVPFTARSSRAPTVRSYLERVEAGGEGARPETPPDSRAASSAAASAVMEAVGDAISAVMSEAHELVESAEAYIASLDRRLWSMAWVVNVASLIKAPGSLVHTGLFMQGSAAFGEAISPTRSPYGTAAIQAGLIVAVKPGAHLSLEAVYRPTGEVLLAAELGATDPVRALPGDPAAQAQMKLQQAGMQPSRPIPKMLLIGCFALAAEIMAVVLTSGNPVIKPLQSGLGGFLSTMVVMMVMLHLKTRDAKGRRVPTYAVSHRPDPQHLGETRMEAAYRTLVGCVGGTGGMTPLPHTFKELRIHWTRAESKQALGKLFDRSGAGTSGLVVRSITNRLFPLDPRRFDPRAAIAAVAAAHPSLFLRVMNGAPGTVGYLYLFISTMNEFGKRRPDHFGSLDCLQTLLHPMQNTQSSMAVLGAQQLLGIGIDYLNLRPTEWLEKNVPRLREPIIPEPLRMVLDAPLRTAVVAEVTLQGGGIGLLQHVGLDAARALSALAGFENGVNSIKNARDDLRVVADSFKAIPGEIKSAGVGAAQMLDSALRALLRRTCCVEPRVTSMA